MIASSEQFAIQNEKRRKFKYGLHLQAVKFLVNDAAYKMYENLWLQVPIIQKYDQLLQLLYFWMACVCTNICTKYYQIG